MRYHNIDGKKVPFTVAEELERDAEEAQWAADAPVRAAEAVDAKRREAYGDIGSQLDEIYHDITAWQARIAQVKIDNPK